MQRDAAQVSTFRPLTYALLFADVGCFVLVSIFSGRVLRILVAVNAP